jgi:nitrogen fixation protein NifU and related proteins
LKIWSKPFHFSDAMNVYDKIIMDHYKNPRNFETNKDMEYSENSSCGDKAGCLLTAEKGIIISAIVHAEGCAICIASASILSVKLKGLTIEAAAVMIHDFLAAIDTGSSSDDEEFSALLDLRRFPVRISCVKLAWQAALNHLGKLIEK